MFHWQDWPCKAEEGDGVAIDYLSVKKMFFGTFLFDMGLV